MPVTAKLSRRFYEQLGDDVAGELVDWFNAVDIEYRAHLERMNDLNWERFRSELRASLAELHTQMRGELNAAISAQNKLMFGYWLTTMLAIAGMFLQINRR